jgi:hypothetical protein
MSTVKPCKPRSNDYKIVPVHAKDVNVKSVFIGASKVREKFNLTYDIFSLSNQLQGRGKSANKKTERILHRQRDRDRSQKERDVAKKAKQENTKLFVAQALQRQRKICRSTQCEGSDKENKRSIEVEKLEKPTEA